MKTLSEELLDRAENARGWADLSPHARGRVAVWEVAAELVKPLEAELAELRLKLAEAGKATQKLAALVEWEKRPIPRQPTVESPPPFTEGDLSLAIKDAFLTGWDARGSASEHTGHEDVHYCDCLGQALGRWLEFWAARDAPNKAGGLSEEQRERLEEKAANPDSFAGTSFMSECLLALANEREGN